MIKRFISVENQTVHFRMAGKGMPIVLLHASPSSSKMLVPLMLELSKKYRVIAPDIPGLGLSQPLEIPFQDCKEYASFFKKFFDHFGLRKFAIYGTATGAQIAIRYALEYREQVSQLYLDNSAHFADNQRDRILENYFPDLTPQYDGSHLMKMWTMVRDLFVFFPWCWAKDEFRLNMPMPPAMVLNMVAMDFLQAGNNYDRAYRAAFQHEKAEHVQELKVPTTIFNWEGSIIRPYIEALLKFDLPDNIKVIETPADRVLRQVKMVECIFENSSGRGEVSDTLGSILYHKKQGHNYVSVLSGDLHYYFDFSSEGKPLVLIHPLKSSGAVVFEKHNHIGKERPLIAFSLPNHGDSDSFEFSFEEEAILDLIKGAMSQLDISEFDVQYCEEELLAAIVPDEFGGHLMRTWFQLRDRVFSEEEIGEIQPELLQLELLERMKFRG